MHLFGTILVRVGRHELGPRDFGGVKPKQILEILLSARGAPVSKDRLADSLWGDSLPRNVSGTLETYISVLRRRLDPDGNQGKALVSTEPGAYRFAVEEVQIDLDLFDSLALRASKADYRSARPLLEEALELVRGDVLEDEPYAEWGAPLREEYGKKISHLLLDASEAALAGDDYQAALAHAERTMGRDPLNERAYRLAMLSFYALGRQREALETFDRCREALADELGIDPLPQTRDLHTAILRQEEAGSLLPRPLPRVEILDDVMSDRLPLLGRQKELLRIQSSISKSLDGSFSLITVEGESGIGKSRFLDETAMRIGEARVGRARCSPVERELSYVPLAMALREALQGISIDHSRYPGLAEVLPELWLSNPAVEISPVKALECVAEIARENAPMALFLDDAQWADPQTVSALGYMARRLGDVPIAIVLAYDPEEADDDEPFRGLQPTARLHLEALTEEDVEPLQMKDLYERTGGHPMFVAACVGAKSEMEAGHLPPTLTELVLDRTRSEGERAHRLLICASVLDHPFEPEVLADLVEEDVFEMLAELERLCDRNLLKAHEEGFGFRGELIREVLSQSISPAGRRLLRRRALGFEALASGDGAPAGSSGLKARLRAADNQSVDLEDREKADLGA
ncbi:MAG: BTAD domain-containing putative transcriptional regulator [Actinomycetota bacterium]